MALTEQLILDSSEAFRTLDAMERRFDNLSADIPVQVDTTDAERRLAQLQSDTLGLAQSLGVSADEARAFGSQLQDASSDAVAIARSLGLTEEEARTLGAELEKAARQLDTAAIQARGTADSLTRVAQAAATAQVDFAGMAQALGVSEDEARRMSAEVLDARAAAARLDAEALAVARSMGLSESEARRFATELRQAERGAADLSVQTERIEGGFSRLRRSLVGVAGGLVAGFGIRELIRGFGAAVDSATALEESVNAINVAFGDGAETIFEFGEQASRSAGLAQSQFQQLVVPIGAMLRNFGFDAQSAADGAVELTQRAADMASVFNTDVTEALTAIQAALRGETDPIERFGASISAARVEAFALSEGLAATKAEITDQAKVQARLGLILADTERVAGDFVNTSDGLANRQRILAAESEELRAELGEALFPAMEQVLEMGESLLPVVEGLIPQFLGAAVASAQFAEGMARVGDEGEDAESASVGLGRALSTGLAAAGFEVTALLNDVGSLAAGIAQMPELSLDLAGNADDLERSTDLLIATQAALLNLERGVDPIDAIAIALNSLQDAGSLTDETLGTLLGSLAQLDDPTIQRALAEIATNFGTFGLTFDDAQLLRGELARLNVEIAGTGSYAATAGEEMAFIDAAISRANEAAQVGVPTFRSLAAEVAESGQSFTDFRNTAQLTGRDIFAGLDEAGRAALNIELFSDAMLEGGFKAFEGASLFSEAGQVFNSAVGLFSEPIEPFLNVANADDELVGFSLDALLGDLATQAEQSREFDDALRELAARGLDSLVLELQAEGPGALNAALAFIGDPEAAREAEGLLTGNISDTIDGMLDSLEDQLSRDTRFQSALTQLAAQGLDALARDLQQQGPAALDLALGFLDDEEKAIRADELISGTASDIVDPLLADLEAELANAPFATLGSDAFLDFASGATSGPVQSAIFAASQDAARIYAAGFNASVASMIRFPGLVGDANLRAPTPTGSGSSAGEVTVNINNATTEDVTTSAAQAAGIVGAATRAIPGHAQ